MLEWYVKHGNDALVEKTQDALGAFKEPGQAAGQSVQYAPGLVSSVMQTLFDTVTSHKRMVDDREHLHKQEVLSLKQQYDQKLEDLANSLMVSRHC